MDSDRGGSLTLSALELGMMHLAHESSAWLERRLKVPRCGRLWGIDRNVLRSFGGGFLRRPGHAALDVIVTDQQLVPLCHGQGRPRRALGSAVGAVLNRLKARGTSPAHRPFRRQLRLTEWFPVDAQLLGNGIGCGHRGPRARRAHPSRLERA
jgi:hypothetical protein